VNLRRLPLVLLFSVAVCWPFASWAREQHLVLIASADAGITPLSVVELRRLFLGLPVKRGGQFLVPVINRSSERSYQVFLQAVMAMSDRSYHRQLLRRFYRSGIQPPAEIRDFDDLLAGVKRRPGAVTYVIRERLPDDPGIRVVQELWWGQLR